MWANMKRKRAGRSVTKSGSRTNISEYVVIMPTWFNKQRERRKEGDVRLDGEEFWAIELSEKY
jgi:hypothetical protein